MEFLDSLQSWHWLALGLLILILEMLGTGGFLLGLGISALTVAVLKAIFGDMAWYWQFILFAGLSVVYSLVYWKKFRRFNHRTEQPLLNERVQRLIGRRVSLLTPVRHGTGKVQIEDALWNVKSAMDIEQGSIVTVVGAEGMTLLVEPYNPGADND